MKKKLMFAAIGAQTLVLLGTLVYLFVSVLSGPAHKKPKAPPAESAEMAEA